MDIHFVTGNDGKFQEVQLILQGHKLIQHPLDLPELQGDARDIAKAKLKEALSIIQAPVIIDDTSIECPALNGLPGPYAKDFLRHLGDEGLAKLIHKYDDHRVFAVSLAGFAEPGEEPLIFEGRIEGTIVAPKGGLTHGKYSFNRVFKPLGWDKTMGEMTMEEHAQVSHRGLSFQELAKYLEKRSSPI